MIDTLILSGGGPSGIAYSGVFQALLEHDILDKELTGIKDIVTTSVGILFSYCLLLQLNSSVAYEVTTRFDIGSMINTADISIDALLTDSGLFETTGIRDIFQSLTKNVLHQDDITLQELYDKTQIKLSVKVFNLTDKVHQFLSHETDPDLSIITLAQITTAIPFFFKNVAYKGNLYCDGGFREGYPRGYCPSENYLGISIKGGCSSGDHEIFETLPILKTMYAVVTGSETDEGTWDDPKIINIEVNLGLNFDVSDDTKQKVIQDAYQTTCEYLTSKTHPYLREPPVVDRVESDEQIPDPQRDASPRDH
jgi:hypothetical protein